MVDGSTGHVAKCGCGGLTAAASAEPVHVYACTCLNCQRESGSAFTYVALFPKLAVAMSGEHQTWWRTADSGRWIETIFCPTCGVTVASRMESAPELIGLSVGCFTDPDFKKPEVLYWASRRHRWLEMPESVELMETQES